MSFDWIVWVFTVARESSLSGPCSSPCRARGLQICPPSLSFQDLSSKIILSQDLSQIHFDESGVSVFPLMDCTLGVRPLQPSLDPDDILFVPESFSFVFYI